MLLIELSLLWVKFNVQITLALRMWNYDTENRCYGNEGQELEGIWLLEWYSIVTTNLWISKQLYLYLLNKMEGR